MIPTKDLKIIVELRKNSRGTLTDMSKHTSVPISSIYDRLQQYHGNLIQKHTSLIDFSQLGFHARANIALKVPKAQREILRDFLEKSLNTNSLYRINNGYDFLVEGVFRHVRDLEEYLERLEEKFEIEQKQVYYIIDDLKREAFMNDEKLLGVVVGDRGKSI